MRKFKVYAIKDGTVIDHIPNGKGNEIIYRLGLLHHDKIVTLGVNFESKKIGRKDIVKIENKELTPTEINQVALLAPRATINIIRNYKRAKKVRIKTPRIIKKLIDCANPNCITNNEPVETRFVKVNKELPTKYKCNYCERVFLAGELLKQQ